MDTLVTLFGWFQKVWILGTEIEIFGVDLLSILLSLTIMGIIIPALLNFAKTTSGDIVSSDVHGVSNKLRSARNFMRMNNNETMEWFFN